jgi:hypothetical protein
MVLVRALGWLLLAATVAALVYDGLVWWSTGAFRLAPFGELWARLDPGSRVALERSLGGHVPGLWRWVVLPFLMTPAFPVLAVLGIVLLWFGQARTRPPEPVGFVLGGSRPRRRRRSSGLS